MSNTMNLSTIPKNVPVLCIPRVFSNIGEKRIYHILLQLNIGEITRIDLVKRTGNKGENYNQVYIHILWNNEENSITARQRLLNGQEIKIIYDDPWFWKVSAYRSPVRNQSSTKQVEKNMI